LALDQVVLFILLLLIATVLLATMAARLSIPYPVLLVLGGGVLGFIPGLPKVELKPDLILVLFLPPLIYSSAWRTSWRNFRQEINLILMLAIGLVLATMVVVAVIVHTFIPGIPWPVAFVLGAVVSPTDTVAAGAIIGKQGLVNRIASIIEGESLVNDATGLVAYSFAIAATVNGNFSLAAASMQFVIVSLGGLLIGLGIAICVSWLHKLLNDTTSQIIITAITPFAAYLLAETLHISGVLAVVAAGLYLGRQSATFFSADTRLQANSFWNLLTFIFNSFIFLLIGFQLQSLLANLSHYTLLSVIGYIVLVSLAITLVRLGMAFAIVSFVRFLRHFNPQIQRGISWRYALVVGWSGMRGGVSLASALAIPVIIGAGRPFPERDLLIFLTFGVILFTLLVQGLSLGPLIQWLKVNNDPSVKTETRTAMMASTQAALLKLDKLKGEINAAEADNEDIQKYMANLSAYYEKKLTLIEQSDTDDLSRQKNRNFRTNFHHILQEIHQEERSTLIKLRATGEINDEVFHKMEQDLDLEEQHLSLHQKAPNTSPEPIH
jgi:monovalent cation/hydrogen antiporter